MSKVARPLVTCSRSAVRAARISGSRWAVGSSRISRSGSASRARASASRWRSPPDTALPRGPGRGIPAVRKRFDPVQQPRLPGRVGQFAVGGGRAGQPEVLPDAGIEDMRVLGAAADHRAHVVGPVGAQVLAAQRGGAAGQVAEPEQDGGDGGLARPARADQRDPAPGGEVQVNPVQGERAVGLVPYSGVPQRHPQPPAGQRARRGRVGDRVWGRPGPRRPGSRWRVPGPSAPPPRAGRSPRRTRPVP